MRLRCLIAAAVLAACLRPAAAGRPVHDLAKPDFTLYHTMAGVFQSVGDIVARYPGVMKIENRTAEAQGYSSTMTLVTVEPGGATADHAAKARLLLNFGEHGRELISSEIALLVLEALGNATLRGELLAELGLPPAAAEPALARAVFQVVPMENVRGRGLVEGGDLCERKNGRGVDPNRNWAVHWGFKERDYDPNEEFPGAAPFSEPEAALLRALGQEFHPHAWINVHSGMDAMFLPYDHKASVPEGAGAQATLALLQELNRRVCGGKCVVGSGGKSVGYLAHGTATDYMHDELHVAVPLTWEVYGDMKAAYNDCFRMFNPLTRKDYDRVVRAWSGGVFALVAGLPGHPGVAPLARLAPGGAAAGGGGTQGGAKAGAGGAAQPEEKFGSGAAEVTEDEDAASASDAAAEQGIAGAGEGEAAVTWFARAAAGTSAMVEQSRRLSGVLAAACVVLLLLWSHPRSRYWLSKLRARGRRLDIPL